MSEYGKYMASAIIREKCCYEQRLRDAGPVPGSNPPRPWPIPEWFSNPGINDYMLSKSQMADLIEELNSLGYDTELREMPPSYDEGSCMVLWIRKSKEAAKRELERITYTGCQR